jgi:hypothetical protein
VVDSDFFESFAIGLRRFAFPTQISSRALANSKEPLHIGLPLTTAFAPEMSLSPKTFTRYSSPVCRRTSF